jgi:hypothetical protein
MLLDGTGYFTTKSAKDTKVSGDYFSELRDLRVFLRKYMCRYDLGDELVRGLVIPAEAGIHPLLLWMPACAGMTNEGKNHAVVGCGCNFILCRRA